MHHLDNHLILAIQFQTKPKLEVHRGRKENQWLFTGVCSVGGKEVQWKDTWCQYWN